jgi:hypothetical protein
MRDLDAVGGSEGPSIQQGAGALGQCADTGWPSCHEVEDPILTADA